VLSDVDASHTLAFFCDPQEVDELEAAGRMEEAAKLANEKVEAQLQQVSSQLLGGYPLASYWGLAYAKAVRGMVDDLSTQTLPPTARHAGRL
jgi:hypothetical protein